MNWAEKAIVVISNIAKPCANGSGELLKVLSTISWIRVNPVTWAFESTPPIVSIWLPPTALQESACRGFSGL